MKTSLTKFVIAALMGAAVLVSCRPEQPMPEVPKAEGAGRVVDVAFRPPATTEPTTHPLSGSPPADKATTR